MDNNETFRYTYSAEQQEEIKNVRQKYLPQEDDKMQQLRRLDNSVSSKALVVSLTAGVVGVLLLALGVCCCIFWPDIWLVPGIVIGVIGVVIAGLAYPLHERVFKQEQKKIAPDILRLTDELLK